MKLVAVNRCHICCGKMIGRLAKVPVCHHAVHARCLLRYYERICRDNDTQEVGCPIKGCITIFRVDSVAPSEDQSGSQSYWFDHPNETQSINLTQDNDGNQSRLDETENESDRLWTEIDRVAAELNEVVASRRLIKKPSVITRRNIVEYHESTTREGDELDEQEDVDVVEVVEHVEDVEEAEGEMEKEQDPSPILLKSESIQQEPNSEPDVKVFPTEILSHSGIGRSLIYLVQYSDGSKHRRRNDQLRRQWPELKEDYRKKRQDLTRAKYRARKKQVGRD